jgi:hypothetical protein
MDKDLVSVCKKRKRVVSDQNVSIELTDKDDIVPDQDDWYEEDGFVVNTDEDELLEDPRVEISADNIISGKRKRCKLFQDNIWDHHEDPSSSEYEESETDDTDLDADLEGDDTDLEGDDTDSEGDYTVSDGLSSDSDLDEDGSQAEEEKEEL